MLYFILGLNLYKFDLQMIKMGGGYFHISQILIFAIAFLNNIYNYVLQQQI